jgi:hypothetical protein
MVLYLMVFASMCSNVPKEQPGRYTYTCAHENLLFLVHRFPFNDFSPQHFTYCLLLLLVFWLLVCERARQGNSQSSYN